MCMDNYFQSLRHSQYLPHTSPPCVHYVCIEGHFQSLRHSRYLPHTITIMSPLCVHRESFFKYKALHNTCPTYHKDDVHSTEPPNPSQTLLCICVHREVLSTGLTTRVSPWFAKWKLACWGTLSHVI